MVRRGMQRAQLGVGLAEMGERWRSLGSSRSAGTGKGTGMGSTRRGGSVRGRVAVVLVGASVWIG